MVMACSMFSSDAHGSAMLPVQISASVAQGAIWIESCFGATATLAIDGTIKVTAT